jgi:lysophospholipase L1-like esterase
MKSIASVLAVSAAAFFTAIVPVLSQAQPQEATAPACAAPSEASRLGQALTHTARRLALGEPLTIVAVGSSSTAGAGASAPAMSYPNRLEAELRARFPGIAIKVLNRGVNGEEAPQMLARFETTVLSEHPDLVIWQVGTNAILRDHAVAGVAPLVEDGIRKLKASGADVVLMDPQYAPKVLAKPDVEAMVSLISKAAKIGNTGLFQRFAIMRQWNQVDGIPFDAVLSPDGLHMNDWSYGCVARLLAIAIADSARAPAVARMPGATR